MDKHTISEKDAGKMFLKKKPLQPPGVIFMPSKRILRIMIEANIEHSQTESLEKYLLRFGLVTNPLWYLNNT